MVSPIQNILTKNLETICQVILAKTSQKKTVNLLMMVLIDLPIIKFTCQRQWLCSSCMTSFFFFLLLIEIIYIAKFWIIVCFFVLKHEKQTLSYIHTKFESDRDDRYFFSNLFCGSTRFSAPTLKIAWAWEVWNYLVWIGLRIDKKATFDYTNLMAVSHLMKKFLTIDILCVPSHHHTVNVKLYGAFGKEKLRIHAECQLHLILLRHGWNFSASWRNSAC